jgi:hypothetical protein
MWEVPFHRSDDFFTQVGTGGGCLVHIDATSVIVLMENDREIEVLCGYEGALGSNVGGGMRIFVATVEIDPLIISPFIVGESPRIQAGKNREIQRRKEVLVS